MECLTVCSLCNLRCKAKVGTKSKTSCIGVIVLMNPSLNRYKAQIPLPGLSTLTDGITLTEVKFLFLELGYSPDPKRGARHGCKKRWITPVPVPKILDRRIRLGWRSRLREPNTIVYNFGYILCLQTIIIIYHYY